MEDWPWFEHAFKDFLGCHQDYLRELEEVDNPYWQGHIAGSLTQCVEDVMGRRKLVRLVLQCHREEAWTMSKQQYNGNTTARQSDLHDKMT